MAEETKANWKCHDFLLAPSLNTTWMPEYGREYWEKNQKDRRLTSEQLVEIAEGHIQREDA